MTSCPKCNSQNVARIIYGYPEDEEEYLQNIAEKKIIPGEMTGIRKPLWFCNECKNKWGNLESDTDSFDYDQGFNLDEVYDNP